MGLKRGQKNPQRDKRILAYHKKHYSLRQIAGIFHLSYEGVRWILKSITVDN
jgi:DNA-binding CsgD family transcriptional regulator